MPLSLAQQVVVDSVAQVQRGHAILIIAGPGSGKTSTLVAALRAAVRAGTPATRIRAISFTNNSAAELKVRLHRAAHEAGNACPELDEVPVSTFHAWVAQLDAQRIEPWTYAPVRLDRASFALALHLYNPRAAEHIFTPAEVAAAERHVEGCETFDEMWTRNFNQVLGDARANREGFEALRAATNALVADLGRLQLHTHGTLMAVGPALARALPPDALEWLFIDEAQDVNRPQHDFVKSLQVRTGCRIFAIADEDQGIYKFRGASSAFLRDLEERATATPATARRFVLSENFRSTPPIVQLSRAWIEPNWHELQRPAKPLVSARPPQATLPLVILTANAPAARGRHASIILRAAANQGFLSTLGEAAILEYSARLADRRPDERRESGLPLNACVEPQLPDQVRSGFLAQLRERPMRTGDWHHALWSEFIERICARHPEGLHGLESLYSCLEVVRRVVPTWSSHQAAAAIEHATKDFGFYGERPEPDYAGARVNQLSLHASKGMEFRAVWLSGTGSSMAVKRWDQEQGQPGLFGELTDWFARLGGANRRPVATQEEIARANEVAATLENRRLLYVGLSRAADLLLISAPLHPQENQDYQRQDNAFCDALEAAADASGADFRVVQSDTEARDFGASLGPQYRHPLWRPPLRHRVESFTSLTRQPLPGEERVGELPPRPGLPGPQSAAALTGDHFHRVMHLLGSEPTLLADRLAGRRSDRDLVARVSTKPQPDVERLLTSFFNDTANQPWTWFHGALTEVPFNGFIPDLITGEQILLKGFIDLLQLDPGSGAPVRVVDWKTGTPGQEGHNDAPEHAQQLLTYAQILRLDPEQVELINYYPHSATSRRRRAAAATPTAPLRAEKEVAPPRAALPSEGSGAPDLTAVASARALLERCRPHCQYRRSSDRRSETLTKLAAALHISPQALEVGLAPLKLARIRQNEINPTTPRPFLGLSYDGTVWLNM